MTTKEIMDSFCLEGKVTERHAKEIEGVLKDIVSDYQVRILELNRELELADERWKKAKMGKELVQLLIGHVLVGRYGTKNRRELLQKLEDINQLI
jgi:hypothetical protein